MAVENLRHVKVFDGRTFKKSVHVIGAGATGSYLLLQLAKLGVQDIHVWDFDKIEDHNLANQLYGPDHIGMNKVDAIQKVLKEQADMDITVHAERVTDQRLDGVVFLLTDTMASRKEIFANSLKFKPHVDLVIETRMGAQEMVIHAFEPVHPGLVEKWESTLTSDDVEVAAPSDCGAQTTIGATASMLAGFASWQFLKHAAGQPVDHYQYISIAPAQLQSKQWV